MINISGLQDLLCHSNTIILGDCLKVLPQLPNDIIDLVITDPPFNIMNKSDIKFKTRADIKQSATFDAFVSYDSYLKFTNNWVGLLIRKMKPNSSIYIFFAIQYITDLMRICLNHGLTYKGVIIWHKTNPAPKIRKSGYLSSTESILFMVRGNPIFNFLGQNDMHNFIETPICMGNERIKDKDKVGDKGFGHNLHPTQKPLKIYEHLIEVSSNPHDFICDPFAGMGTANIACKNTNRNCFSIEINSIYAEHAQTRLREMR